MLLNLLMAALRFVIKFLNQAQAKLIILCLPQLLILVACGGLSDPTVEPANTVVDQEIITLI